MAALLRGGDSGVELLLARGRVGIFTLPCATGWRPIPEADHLLCPVNTASICERVQSRHGLDSSLSARAVTVRSHGCHAAHNSLTKRTLWPLQTMRSTAAILHRRPAPPASNAASGARTSKLRRRGPSPARGSARYPAPEPHWAPAAAVHERRRHGAERRASRLRSELRAPPCGPAPAPVRRPASGDRCYVLAGSGGRCCVLGRQGSHAPRRPSSAPRRDDERVAGIHPAAVCLLAVSCLWSEKFFVQNQNYKRL